MSKSIAGILETAVGIGLEFVPGFQAIGTSLIVTGVATTASALLTSTPKPEQSQTAIKSSIPVRVSAYGASRLTHVFVA